MKYVRLISRLLVAVVFIFSGFVKAVDPLGSTYKFIDYFHAFNMPWFDSIAFPLAIFLSSIEFTIGVGLLISVQIRLSVWLALIFMLFFTPLTLILALYNPVHDCGCFGDALIISNWQTFYKNIIIITLVLIVFVGRKKMEAFFSKLMQWVLFAFAFISITAVSIYCYNNLPLLDFRPYKIGSNIIEKMSIPDNEKNNVDQFETILRYKNLKTGEIKDFTMDNYPWQDTLNWKFDTAVHTLIKKGYTPPIHDFSITSDEEGDITDLVLNDSNYVFLLISYNLNKANTKVQPLINKLYDYTQAKGYRFICLTSSTSHDIEEFKKKFNPQYKFYSTDEITLKTIIRSNPGLVLLYKGTVLYMWHKNNLPNVNDLNDNLLAWSIDKIATQSDMRFIYAITFLFLLLISFIINLWYSFKNR